MSGIHFIGPSIINIIPFVVVCVTTKPNPVCNGAISGCKVVELRITVCHSIYIYEFLAAHVLQLKACSCVCDCSGMFQQGRMMQ